MRIRLHKLSSFAHHTKKEEEGVSKCRGCVDWSVVWLELC